MMNRYEEAVATYQAILADDPANLDALLYLGALHARNRAYEKARESLEKLVSLDDQSFGGYKYLARLYREMRYFDKAVLAYSQALDLGWSVPLALEAGELLEQQGRFEEGIVLYRQVLEEDETNDQARQRLVGLFLQTDRGDDALAELEKIRRSSPEPEKIDFTIGRVLMDSDRLDEAIAKFSSVLAADPGQDGARYMLALARLKKEERNLAKEELLKIPAESKMYEEAIVLLVRVLLDEKDYAAMEQVLASRLEAPVTAKPRFYALLASVYHQQGKNAESEKTFRQGLAAFPDNVTLLFEYGIFLDSTGNHEGALAKMEEVLKIEPDNAVALNFLGYSWADHGVNLDKALEYIQRAVALRPGDGFIRDSLGWVFFKMGKFDRAREELEAALAMAPDDPTLNEHLGDAWRALGSMEKARGQYERALSLFGDEESKAKLRNKLKELAP
jgi:tetratricopeptide (TPR) repeat protein